MDIILNDSVVLWSYVLVPILRWFSFGGSEQSALSMDFHIIRRSQGSEGACWSYITLTAYDYSNG